jgi:hypothetical protein
VSADLRLCDDLERIATQLRERVAELEASAPTADAYSAACKALAHWRKEARRLGRLAKVTPREWKPK